MEAPKRGCFDHRLFSIISSRGYVVPRNGNGSLFSNVHLVVLVASVVLMVLSAKNEQPHS